MNNKAWNDMWWWCTACQAYHPTGSGCYGQRGLARGAYYGALFSLPLWALIIGTIMLILR